jgi:molecular chaperone GrpE
MRNQDEAAVFPNRDVGIPHERGAIAAEVFELEMADQKDRYLRLVADFDNYRKRMNLEMGQRAAAQKEKLMQDLLPVLDNLERGLSVGSSSSSKELLEGVVMTLLQFKRILHDNGVEAEESLGITFNPVFHEAIGSRYDPSKADQIILEVAQRGYRQGKDSFRAAKVIVNAYPQ